MKRTGREGFALPMTLFLISIITLMLTAAFTKVQSDRRIALSSGASIEAMTIARAGVQQYMGTRPFNSPGSPTSPWRPPDGDSIRITVGSGYADVIATVLRRPADTTANWLYVIRSVGHLIDPTQGSDPQAVRTVAQFAQWQTGRMNILAAYTAANRITNGGTGPVSIYGVDQCGIGAPAVAGLRIPTGSADPDGNWSMNGNPTVVKGLTNAQLAAATNIDWTTIQNGGLITDYNYIRLGDGTYSSQFINGNATINNNWGSGLLIVTGDLTFSGWSSYWLGVVLVGGRIYFNANFNTIEGAVISGLDGSNGGSNRTSIGDHSVTLLYYPCLVTQSLLSVTGFAPITNGWVDNWATY